MRLWILWREAVAAVAVARRRWGPGEGWLPSTVVVAVATTAAADDDAAAADDATATGAADAGAADDADAASHDGDANAT